MRADQRLLGEQYAALTQREQREYRILSAAGGRTPEEAVRSWLFFTEYYLKPDPEDSFDPDFYQHPVLPTPPIHAELVRIWTKEELSAVALPRSAAKSTVSTSEIIRRLLTRPSYQINLYLAKEDFVVERLYRIKYQLASNERILQDFGESEPARGSAPWSSHMLVLAGLNSVLRGYSIEGHKRSPRANLIFLDDPEKDEDEEGTDERRELVLRKLKRMIFRVLLPMIGHGNQLAYLGTIIGNNSLLYHIMRTDEDARFARHWHKLWLPAFDSAGNNVWREYYTPEFMQRRLDQMGYADFSREYLNDPVSGEDAPLCVHPDRHEYMVGAPAEGLTDSPMDQRWKDLPVTYNVVTRSDGPAEESLTPVRTSWHDFLTATHRGICVDYAATTTIESDFSSIVTCGVTPDGILVVLDAWRGRMRPSELTNVIWETALRWQVQEIGIEAVAMQFELYESVRDRAEEYAKRGALPRVWPLKWGTIRKADRILSLESLFSRGMIKFPGHLRYSSHMASLYREVHGYTRNGRGLAHDDMVDTLSMFRWLFRGTRAARAVIPVSNDPLSRIKRGEYYDDATGVSHFQMVNPDSLSAEDRTALIVAGRDKMERERPFSWDSGDDDEDPALEVHTLGTV